MEDRFLTEHDQWGQVSAAARTEDVATPPTFGVEEEFFVIDPRSRRILSRAPEVLANARSTTGHLGGEFTRAQVEASSPVCEGTADARRFLRASRLELDRAAAGSGLAVIASGTAVLGDPAAARVSEGRRYAEIAAHFGDLRACHAVCGCHVHVGMPDDQTAVAVSGHLRRWMPFLVALSANSPFQDGRDTGYASWRTVTWNRLPSAGPPPLSRSLEEHQRAVRALADFGAILDPHMVYWDVRPSDHLPTLEIRVGDVATTADEALLFAALTRGLASGALTDVRHGVPAPEITDQALRAATWRAARDGLEGHVPDAWTGETLPADWAVERLSHAATPGLVLNGDADLVESLLARVRAAGSGAARQRAAHEWHGRLTDVVDHLVRQTREGVV